MQAHRIHQNDRQFLYHHLIHFVFDEVNPFNWFLDVNASKNSLRLSVLSSSIFSWNVKKGCIFQSHDHHFDGFWILRNHPKCHWSFFFWQYLSSSKSCLCFSCRLLAIPFLFQNSLRFSTGIVSCIRFFIQNP